MKDALIRAGRTFLQAFIGTYIALATASGFEELLTLRALEAAGVAGLIAALSFAQNAVEGRKGVTYGRG